MRIHGKLLQGCPLPSTGNSNPEHDLASSALRFDSFYLCFLFLCWGLCLFYAYFMRKANVSEPITSVSDWKLALQRIFGQDSIIGFNCLQAAFDISLTSNEGCWNDCEAGWLIRQNSHFPRRTDGDSSNYSVSLREKLQGNMEINSTRRNVIFFFLR